MNSVLAEETEPFLFLPFLSALMSPTDSEGSMIQSKTVVWTKTAWVPVLALPLVCCVHRNHSNALLSSPRTGYIVCGIQCKIKMQGSLLKN